MDLFIPLTKFDDEQRMVYGYASTEALDSQGEKVTKAAIEAALPEYMRFANIREMHQLSAVGVAKEVELDEKGLYVCAKVVDDLAWKKVKEKVYKGFSVGGKKLEKADGLVTKVRLSEISLVDRPANPECRFDLWKAEGEIPPSPVEDPVPSGSGLENPPSVDEELLKEGGPPTDTFGAKLSSPPSDEPQTETEAPLAKVGSRHSTADLDHIQKIHDHTVSLGAGCSGKAEKAESEGDLKKMETQSKPKTDSVLETESVSTTDEQLSKLEAALSKTEETLAKIQSENEELKDRLAKLESEPEPPKAALKDLTARPVAKEEDAEDLRKTEETDPTDTLGLIKAAHRRPMFFGSKSGH
jgi:hypothetical protein